eukprot:GHVT01013343.1.p1 GENE.GHVT01013343.1~~GHVT01013343.1.p1  ORF type:complete len:101 (-),score=0.71 GHVT01013343.1:334-636(-)
MDRSKKLRFPNLWLLLSLSLFGFLVFLVGLIKKKIILYRYPNLPKERNKKGVSGMIQTQANEQESYRIRVVLLCRLLTSIPCCSRFVSFYPVVLSSPSRP